MLEKMGEFFDARLSDYEEHQMTCIAGAKEFYPYTATLLPFGGKEILDLGCGTGLELEHLFAIDPQARVTGIDLAPGMLATLEQKFCNRAVRTVCASYFDADLGRDCYDAAVSVESFHHFTQEEKIFLYQKIHAALKSDGYLILTDYFAASDEEEQSHRQALERLKREQGIEDCALYHYDTPLTVAHEIETLQAGGFFKVELLKSWGATSVLKAVKR